MTQKNIPDLINNPKKPNSTKPGGGSGGSGSGSGRNVEKLFGKYVIIDRAFYQRQPTQKIKSGFVDIQLCNFICKIVEVVTHDDGLQDQTFLKVEGKRDDGFTLPTIEIPNAKFISAHGTWVNEYYDMRAFIYPGASINTNLRAAIQMYSTLEGEVPRRQVYKSTGFKQIDGQWCYLTGSGAITADGLREDIQVDMGQGHMSRYRLPAPMTGDAIKEAAGLVSTLLAICPNKPQIGATLLAAVARAPLGECHPIDFAIFIHGMTGVMKSAITAIPLGFFGDFTARRFPANFTDTDLDIEIKAFQAKDGVYVVDDFKPSVSLAESSKLYAKAERLIRNTGNQAGRGWRGSDRQAKAAPYNRSMTFITGEDLPKGQSLLGRLLILELNRADVDCTTLSQLQHAAAAGWLSGLMATYLQWLASRMTIFKTDFPKIVTDLRTAAIRDGHTTSHTRASEIYANLVGGAETFFDFMRDVGGLSTTQCNSLMGSIEGSLKKAFSEQYTYQIEQDETERFLNLLRAAFSSGNAHIADRLNQGPPPSRPYVWGWRSDTVDMAGDKIHKPNGDCIGWYCAASENEAGEIWLQQETAFKVVQQFARNQGESFLLSAASLWRRLHEKRMILKTEPDPQNNRPRLTVKRVVAGRSARVMVLSADLIESG